MSVHPKPKCFAVTGEHLKLAREMYTRWNGVEYGAPEIDGKRPYGNSDVPKDIADILGWEVIDPDRARVVHEEMQVALEVFLRTGAFEAGDYQTSSPYTRDWRKVAP